MTRLLSLLALALLATVASAQPASVVVSQTDDGYVLSSVSDAIPSDAAVLTRTADGWHLMTVGADGSVRDVAARVAAASARHQSANRHREAMERHRERMSQHRDRMERLREVTETFGQRRPVLQMRARGAAPRLRYSVWVEGVPDGAVPALLADLGGDAAFVQASSESRNGRSKLSLTFEFQDVGAWTAWGARTDLDGRLGAFPGVHQRTRVEVQRGARRDGIIDIIGDGEIIDMDIMDDGDVVGDGEIIDDID